ncbi:glutathione gamma-glutamylcysteinyltransferase [Nannocystis exedens]|uniref:glutathione gamma-glutamylcysteinyltransferase n=1 Tax=Nannocystis exedens TaxID=54 RepID=A0A1I1XLT5_9BACT|nr:phytochelatin synthase family protein [Nannocystis exedens]PCC73409.1 Phytochelatin synthase [Nannocystis exedens]SFE06733.1 glutathione gamma-glutamylcysteinyltransferase [Nannocystis exedens]
MNAPSLYRRPLPPQLVAFASPEGRALFDAARAAGGLESFFPLIEQFHTQADPAFCGLGTLVVALNALGVDPGRLWKGPWRWFSEELLDCCSPLERVRAQGITLDEFACLARCNGASADVYRPDAFGLTDFRAAVAAAARASVDPALVVSYDRGSLGQTGSGHFSPIGGYDPASDHVLVLDVARFKYPPHWVALPALYAATQPADPATGRPRGWVALRRHSRPPSLLFTARCLGDGGFEALVAALDDLAAALARVSFAGLDDALRALFSVLPGLPLTIERRPLALSEQTGAAEALLAALRGLPLHARVAALGPPWPSDAVTLLLLALPARAWSGLGADARAELSPLLDPDRLPPPVRVEADHVRRQLADLCALARGPACDRCEPGCD